MSFIVEQEIKGQIYIYLSTAYWDKDKKQARQKRICLGKKDLETGNIIPAKKNTKPESCKDYGNFYLLYNIAKKIGLTEDLKEIFYNTWDQILTYAFCDVSERTPMYLCRLWIESTYTELESELPAQRVDNFLKIIGESAVEQIEFSKLWADRIEDDKHIVFDIASVSSYSDAKTHKTHSYNSYKEDSTEINLGILFGQSSFMPLFYDVYKGSVRDISTLNNMLRFTQDLKSKEVRYVLNKGFYSVENLKEMDKNTVEYVVTMPFSEKKAKDLINNYGKSVSNENNLLKKGKQLLYGIKQKIKIDGISLYSYIFFDKTQRDEFEEHLTRRLEEIENKIKEKQYSNKQNLIKYLKVNFIDFEALFTIHKKNGIYELERKKEEIRESLKYKGFSVKVSNCDMDCMDILSLYSKRDAVEKVFDNMKNELDIKHLKVHSKEVMDGRLFIGFIALIIYSWVNNLMIEKGLYKSYTIEEVMHELKKIKIVVLGSDMKILTKLTKEQKDLFKNFGITMPLNA